MKYNRINTITAFVINIAMAYVLYFLCRIEYLLVNWNTFDTLFRDNSVIEMLTGSWYFDTSAILYSNSLYALMMLFPCHYKETHIWRKICKWLYVIVNSICMAMNLGDSVYFRYTGKRTTTSVLGEFQNENNIVNIISDEILMHWYLFILGALFIFALWKLYVTPNAEVSVKPVRWKGVRYYMCHTVALLVFIPLCVAGMRGGFTTAVRPITISNANQYVTHPTEAALILNTPFALMRTMGVDVFHDPKFFTDKELAQIYTPVHQPVVADSARVNRLGKKNIVVLIVESFGREYIGAYNEKLEDGHYKGYTPFMDSLYKQSLSFDYTFANGRQSIDGMPSILSGIPRFQEPFFLTPASMNEVSGLAKELKHYGYYSAFFHGAENGSMGFEAFAKSTGYDAYFGRTEFDEDKRFGGEKEFDGTWAIWDEPFMQFYAMKMSEFKQPFITSIFTASSHHPYVVPEKYKDVYKDETPAKAKGLTNYQNPIHKCIRYTDMALRKFFETASKQPWYKNTIFVFTSDHTNIFDHEEYGTDLGLFGAPLLFFDPSGEMPRGRRHCIAQQTDILPTMLDYLGYPRPYIAWGVDLFNTPDKDTWAVNFTGGGVYQFVNGDYLIQFDGQNLKAVYNYKSDWLLKHNLLGKNIPAVTQMERQLKAIIQTYMQRMMNDQLTVSK